MQSYNKIIYYIIYNILWRTTINHHKKASADKFTTKVGFLLAAVGSAVGLGAIWRFPYMVSVNGHGAFIIMYLVCVLLIGIPLVLSEYIIGREAARRVPCLGVVSIWKAHSKSKWAHLLSYIFVFTSWLIYTYYMVICGWVFIYFFKSIIGAIDYSSTDTAYYESLFASLFNNNWEVIIATAAALLVTAVISIKGISKGIERLTVIGMPLLFIILLIIVIRVLTLENAMDGLKNYFAFTASDFTLKRLLAALGQAFFALSLGIGILVTYSSYVKQDNNLLNTASNTALIASLVAILAGMMIIPALFVFGFNNTAGPGLIFISLPAVFSKMYFGAFFAILFFALVIIAAITSTISLLEVVTPVVMDTLKTTRTKAIALITAITMVVSILQTLSFNDLSFIKIFGKTIFDFSDYLSSNILMPLGAIITCLYLGFVINKYIVAQLKQYDQRTWIAKLKVYEIWFFWVKYTAPVIIIIILIMSLKG